jgi:RNA polymerase sigma-70 factor (sigma-E family)
LRGGTASLIRVMPAAAASRSLIDKETPPMDDRDDAAFAAFVGGRSGALQRTAYLLTGDHGRAEDLLQTTLLKIYLAWPRIDDLGAVEEYTRRTMVRTQVSFWRRAARREVVLADVPDRPAMASNWSAGQGYGSATSRIEDRDELWRALSTLGPRQRAVVVLRFYEDLTEAEIARVLGCSVGTVKSQLSRGLSRLQKRLTGPGRASPPAPPKAPAQAMGQATEPAPTPGAAAAVPERSGEGT